MFEKLRTTVYNLKLQGEILQYFRYYINTILRPSNLSLHYTGDVGMDELVDFSAQIHIL